MLLKSSSNRAIVDIDDMISLARFSAYLVSSIGTLQWYRYPNSTLESAYRYRYSGTSIGTPLEISLVSIHGKEYRYPSSLMELEYRYWLSSTGTGCLRTVFGVP
ncbi:hypothetical protein GQ457_07G006610 [Hibiscus cannabinus]